MITMVSPASSHHPESPKLNELLHHRLHHLKTTKRSKSVKTPTISAPHSVSGQLRSLTISGPRTEKKQVEETISNKFRPTIILVAKYSFTAESSNELSVTKGDILKLLDQPRDGWVLVKYIDKVHPPGLIPATYLDIAVNDHINPITLSWLHGVENPDIVKDHNYLNLQFNKVEAVFQTINNKAYPVSASILNFFLFKDRYWYRLDVKYSDKSRAHLCRYYQDFYNLHITLLDLVSLISQSAKLDELKLPKLPEPLPTTTTLNHYENRGTSGDSTKIEKSFEQETAQVNMLLKRCNDLNVYINKLILNKYFQTSEELIAWLELTYKDLPGFICQASDGDNEEELTNDEINSRILPDSIDILKVCEERKLQHEQQMEALRKEQEAEVLNDVDDADLPIRTKSKNIYNNYQQASHIMAQASRQNSVKLGRTNSKSSPFNSARASDSPNNLPRMFHGGVDQKDYIDTSLNSASTTFSRIDEEDQTVAYSPDTSRGSHKVSRKNSQKPSKESSPSTQFTGLQVMSPKNSLHGASDAFSSLNPQLLPHFKQKPPPMGSPVFYSPSNPYSPKLGSIPKVKSQSPYQPVNPYDKPYQAPQSMPPKMSPMSVNPNVFPVSGYTNVSLPNANLYNAQISPTSVYSKTSSSPSPTSVNSLSHQYLKCKIVNPHDETIVLSLPKSQIRTIGDLKNLVKSNVFYNKLFIKLPNLNNFENIDVVRFNIAEFLKFHDKVLLRIA